MRGAIPSAQDVGGINLKVTKAVFLVGYLGFVIAGVMILTYSFFYHYLKSLPAPVDIARSEFMKVPGINPDLIRKLGYISEGKRSSFTRFPALKPEDTIRIGCFGDSYTFGAEVDESTDYPSLLQSIFNREGFANIEVLNFGSLAYGFPQSYLLWEGVGVLYGLDYLLLGPKGFQPERTTSFSFFEDFHHAHSRFILEQDELRLVDALGENPQEQIRAHRRFFPYWRYLRYDAAAPLFLKALIPSGRILRRNPFYYYNGEISEEARTIHTKLLAKMAEPYCCLVVLNHDEIFLNQVQLLGSAAIKPILFRDQALTNFPYRATGHYGPMGNQVLAEMMFGALTDQAALEVAYLRPGSIAAAASGPDYPQPYQNLGIAINQTIVGRFTTYDHDGTPQEVVDCSERLSGLSLLAFVTPEFSLMGALSVPVPVACPRELEVTLRLELDDGPKEYILNKTHPAGSSCYLSVIEFSGEPVYFADLKVWIKHEIIHNNHQLCCVLKFKRPLHSAEILVGEHVIARTRSISKDIYDSFFKNSFDYKITFKPTLGKVVMITADPSGLIIPEELPDAGTIDLVFDDADGIPRTTPIAWWQKESATITLTEQRFDRPLVKSLLRKSPSGGLLHDPTGIH